MVIFYVLMAILCGPTYTVRTRRRCADQDSPIIYVETPNLPETYIVCCFGGQTYMGWKKNNRTLGSDIRTTILNEQGYSVLILQNSRREELDTYSCHLRDNEGAEIKLHSILTKHATVAEYKPVQFINFSKDQTIYFGSSSSLATTIQWSVKGASKPLIVYNPTLSKKPQNGRYMVDGFGNLVISGVRYNDSTTYVASLLDTGGTVKETKQFEVFVGTAPFRAVYPQESYHFTVNDKGVIHCNTYGMDLNNYWLFKRNGSSEETRIERDSEKKYQMEMEGTLTIRNVQKEDIGAYTCVSENNFGTISSVAKVIGIIVPARIVRLNNGYGRVGANVSIVCEVEGQPPPKITWWRNNQPINNFRQIRSNSSELFFDYMIQGDSGIYACVADNNATMNGIKTFDVRDVELYNEEKPFINANLSTTLVFVTEFNNVANIKCVSENLPFSRLYIKYNGTEIREAGISIDKDMNQLVLDYVFSFVSDSQLGIYTCVAENTFGYDTLDVLVALMKEPDPPSNIRVSHVDTSSAVIRWEFPEIYLRSRYHDFQVLLFTKNHLLYFTILEKKNYVRVEGLLKNTQWNVQIRSHIISGWSEPSKTVSFRTLEVGAPHPPSILNNVLFLDGIDIHLMWQYPMRNFNDSNYVFSVEWCRVDYFNITNLHTHCNFITNLYSTEFMITGLAADNFYVINVGASNFRGSRVSRDFIVIAGKNPHIGAVTSKLDSIFISLIVILLLLLIILLIDLTMLCLYSYGVIYFLYMVFTAKWPHECSCKAKYTKCETTELTKVGIVDANVNIEDVNVYKHEAVVPSVHLVGDKSAQQFNDHTPVSYEMSQLIPYSYDKDEPKVKFLNVPHKKPRNYGKSLRTDPSSRI